MKNEKLFVLLSAYMALELKLRNYHWNVECHHFTEYHKFFEEQYDEVADNIDEIAEKIRMLGDKVPANFENIIDMNKKNDIDITKSANDSKSMILCQIDSNNKIVEMIKDLKNELDGKREYMGTCILLDDLLKTREKACWFLTSLSK